jgi:hypothetical protein
MKMDICPVENAVDLCYGRFEFLVRRYFDMFWRFYSKSPEKWARGGAGN